MTLEDWELYVGVKRVRAWGPVEAEFVEHLPPDEQDLVYELAVRLDARPVEPEHVDELAVRRTGRRDR